MLVLAILVIAPTRVRADRWLVVEAPAAIAISEAQSGAFRTGVMPALGVYAGGGAALGVRLRAGVLRNGPAPSGHLGDPGLGGLGTAGVALRLSARGLWIEGVAGGGLTGHDVVPSLEAGVGWDFAAGAIDLGPSARYLRVINRDPMAAFGSVDLVLVGIDLQLGRARARPPRRAVVAAPAAAAPVSIDARDHTVERDPDRVVEREASCASDSDGCELAAHLFLHDDRIVLDERVLFDSGRARVKSRGRELIGELVRIWREHPEWRRMAIEGHADVRGSDEANLALSQHRAERVRDVFVRLGVDPARLDVIGRGRSRPIDPGTSEVAHQRNRRVEFVIERAPVAGSAGSQ
jgi:outer membrane protein OmpA-like peptidoglycan-associated protein